MMDVLGSKLGLNKIISLGVNGLVKNNSESVVGAYLDSNKKLGIVPDLVWRDDLSETVLLIKEVLKELISLGHITHERAEVIKCPCGVVESLTRADNISLTRKRYENGRCLVCNQNILINTEMVYLFHFPNYAHNLPMRVFPKFYEKEFRSMANKFSGYKFLISRSRSSAFSLGNMLSLDLDFVWQLFLSVLYRSNYQVEVLVGANRNLMACLFAAIFLYLIDKREVSIIIPPFYLATGRKKLNDKEHSLTLLLSRYRPNTIRLALAAAMNWKKKETVIDFEFMELIQKISYRIQSLPQESLRIDEVASIFNEQTMRRLLSNARKTREIYNFQELYGVI